MGYRLSAGFLVYFTLTVALAVYFAFAAVKGDLGVIERLTAKAELADLTAQKQRLQLQVDEMANKSRRLSDTYLDLDLLDERARDVLGVMRANELTIR